MFHDYLSGGDHRNRSAAVRGGDRGRGEPVAEAVTYHIAVYPFYYYRCADYENRRTDVQAGFEQIFVLYHPGVYGTADIIDTYVYRMGLQEGKFELATAVGLFKSVINFALVVIANKTARMAGEEGIY